MRIWAGYLAAALLTPLNRHVAERPLRRSGDAAEEVGRCNEMIRASGILWWTALFAAVALAQTDGGGKGQFLARCAGCHGEDSTGGGHGPNIIDVQRPRAASRSEVRDLIRKGLPEAGMPAFPLVEAELDSIAGYFMTLKTPAAAPSASTADSATGERFFIGKGGCAGSRVERVGR